MAVPEGVGKWLLSVAGQGGTWWMVVVLLVVATLNSLSAGTLTFILGPVQAATFALVVTSRKYTWPVAPLAMTIGGYITIHTYMNLMKTSGVDSLIAEHSSSKWAGLYNTAMTFAADYGVFGLGVIGVLPVPTAISVVAGVLAKIDESTILVTLVTTRFVKVLLVALSTKLVTQNMPPEELMMQHLGITGSETSGKKSPPTSGKKVSKKKD
jgi:membrane protein YqaA with SNARE-associated domain